MMCGDCRLHYKKYGYDKHIANRPATPLQLRQLNEAKMEQKMEQVEKFILFENLLTFSKYEEEIVKQMPADEESGPKVEKDEVKHEHDAEIKRPHLHGAEDGSDHPPLKKPKHEAENVI